MSSRDATSGNVNIIYSFQRWELIVTEREDDWVTEFSLLQHNTGASKISFTEHLPHTASYWRSQTKFVSSIDSTHCFLELRIVIGNYKQIRCSILLLKKKIILTHNLDGANNVVQVSQVCSISSHNMWFTTKIGCFIQNQCVCSKNIYTFSVNKNQFKFMHISEWKLIYPRLGCSLRCPVSIWAILIRMSWP